MSQVWIGVEDGLRGSVPARCAKTGTRCITRRPVPASDLPTGLEWLAWTGLWPRIRGREQPHVVLSMLPWVHTAHVALVRARDATAAAALVLLVLVVALDGAARATVWTALLAVLAIKVLVGLVGSLWAVRARVDQTGDWVLLDRVHAEFVAATEAVTDRPETVPALSTRATVPSPRAAGAPASD